MPDRALQRPGPVVTGLGLPRVRAISAPLEGVLGAGPRGGFNPKRAGPGNERRQTAAGRYPYHRQGVITLLDFSGLAGWRGRAGRRCHRLESCPVKQPGRVPAQDRFRVLFRQPRCGDFLKITSRRQ
jgi:hypothetical protein